MVAHDKEALTLIVALHELLGHGTGKLFTKDAETGELNFPADLKNPFTGEPITTYYLYFVNFLIPPNLKNNLFQHLSTETWSQKFGKLHSGYEECRADTVAIHLMHFEEPYQIFSSYVILSVVREGDPSVLNFEFTEKDGKDYFYLHVDRSKLRTTAFKALEEFLRKLHIYKSMGDFTEAEKMFNHYSEVDETMARVRDIVIANKIPRRLTQQPNLFMDPVNGEPFYKNYEDTFEGFIQSAVERYPDPFQEEVYRQWIQDAPHLRRREE